MGYKEIHIWEFPPTITFLKINRAYRLKIFEEIKKVLGSNTNLLNFINQKAKKYNLKRSYNTGHLSTWKKGIKKDQGKLRNINIPLWIIIEFSKLISKKDYKEKLKEIEQNIEYYTGTGKSHPITKPKIPLYLTPEMVSVIFHFMGDGHIGRKTVVSSYRQMNKQGLENFLHKLKNIFGEFNYPISEFKQGRLNVPKIITEFYKHYFKLPNTNTFEAYVPTHIKSYKKEFLLAGLISFIVDEAHIGEVITIYGKNKRLMEDMKEIGIKCGYLCHPLREKYAYGKFDVYRFSISIKSYSKFYEDINKLSKLFPTCDLAHKMERLIKKIK